MPTPIDQNKRPDLGALLAASRTVGQVLAKGDVVVFESTVYPGATEEVCIPEIEARSGLAFNTDFFAGYSPERINPGDQTHRLPDIVKVTSGSTPAIAELVDAVYATVITAGTHKVASIRVAEAAKVIENIQRDVNIALVNELAMLFKELGLETQDVLEAAGTKWNFHGYRPGLVGGHCIGVDPYYLTHKAQSVGFHAEMILAGRRINDGMARLCGTGHHQGHAEAQAARSTAPGSLVMGFTFKENCPDTRNTKSGRSCARNRRASCAEVDRLRPCWRTAPRHKEEYGLVAGPTSCPQGPFDTIILAVKSRCHTSSIGCRGAAKALLRDGGLLYDIKGVLPAAAERRADLDITCRRST